MNIYDELYRIASAKYGLQLKDPVYNAFDTLVEYPKFELIENFIDKDITEFDELMSKYYNTNTTTKTLRNIMDLIYILNGRKGFYAKSMEGHHPDREDNVSVWVNMLGRELANSGTGSRIDGVATKGNGVVNGSKIRLALYRLLEILQKRDAVVADNTVIFNADSPCYILGRDLYFVTVYGNEAGVGYYKPSEDKYYVDVTITDLYKSFNNVTIISIEIGDRPLIENQSVTYSFPLGTFGYSLYEIKIKDFTSELQVGYIIIREHYELKPEDYIIEKYGPSGTIARTVFYTGNEKELITPSTFDGSYLKTIGIGTFSYTDVERVEIPEGVTTIE